MTITDARVRAVLAAAMVASAGLALWVGRDTSFSRDELNWIIDTPGLDLRGALEAPRRPTFRPRSSSRPTWFPTPGTSACRAPSSRSRPGRSPELTHALAGFHHVTFLDRLIGFYERVFDAAVTLDMRGPRRGAAAVDPDRS